MTELVKDIQDIVSNLKSAGVNFKKKIILVTGGAGFLGSWICDVLSGLGANVQCLDNLSSGRIENIQHLISRNNFTYIRHDISNQIHFDNKIDLIFHFASRASPLEFSRFPIQILKANTLGTY